MKETQLILQNVKIASFRSLADGTIRITLDLQELTALEAMILMEIAKQKECSIYMGNGAVNDKTLELVSHLSNLDEEQLTIFINKATT